jgi:hypothetical protein
MNAKMWFRFILMGLMLSTLVLAGCEGDDGDDGTNGTNGADGQSAYELAVENGYAGTEEEWLDSFHAEFAPKTNESCNVCHGVGQVSPLSINELHPLVDTKIDIANIDVASVAGVGDTVNFDAYETEYDEDGNQVVAEDEDGNPIPVLGLTLDDFRFYVADIVPAFDPDAIISPNYPTDNVPVDTWWTSEPERWLYERGGTSRAGVPYPNGTFTDNGLGNYTYEFLADLEVGDLARAPEFSRLHTQRLMLRAGDIEDALGTPDLSREAAIVDFIIPLDGNSTGVLSQDEADLSRALVVQAACTNCHGDPLQSAAHGSSYQTPQGCVICHTPIGADYGDVMQADGAWLASLIHSIHGEHQTGVNMTAWDWSEVTYPQFIQECEVCHFDAGQAQADSWKTNPTVEACTTCHDVTFGAGATHSGGSQTNDTCFICHPADGNGVGQSVVVAHKVVYDADELLYNTTIILSDDANADGVYEVGEAIVVTVTVDYPGFDYLNTDTAFLRAANLYVYGPRALAVPVLTPGSTTDPDYMDPEVTPPGTPPDQGRSMLITAQADDPNVLTDATGFKYQLLAITEQMAAGTYLSQSNIDFSATGDRTTDGRHRGPRYYPLDGWQLKTIQIGSATESLKVAGECTGCHEQRNFSTYAHRSYFGTDGCLACHDQSGNHADPLTNRVHAVHAANTEGDLTNVPGEPPSRVWDWVTFPRELNESCAACHNSGNFSHRTNPNGSWGFACVGCHGGNTEGAYDHMLQSGSPFPQH